MTVEMDASTAPCSVGPLSCLPLQTRPIWDMGTTHAEERKVDSLQPGLGNGSMLLESHVSPLNLSSESLSLSLFSSEKITAKVHAC